MQNRRYGKRLAALALAGLLAVGMPLETMAAQDMGEPVTETEATEHEGEADGTENAGETESADGVEDAEETEGTEASSEMTEPETESGTEGSTEEEAGTQATGNTVTEETSEMAGTEEESEIGEPETETIGTGVSSETEETEEVTETAEESETEETEDLDTGVMLLSDAADFTYNVTDAAAKTIEIIGYTGGDTDVVIPEEIDGYTVTGIGEYAFYWYHASGLTSIEIPGSVTSIGEHAFYGNSSLRSIKIPGSVTSIGREAFSGCSGLTGIEIPGSVTDIGEDAFWHCSGLTSIVVDPENAIYSSGNGSNCIIEKENNILITGCETTIIPEGVTRIGSFAFFDCSGLTSIEIPESVTVIEASAFSGCSGLTSIEIPKSVTSIWHAVFSDCSSLTSIVVDPENTTYSSGNGSNCIIEKDSNELITGCKTTIIPEGVMGIGGTAFSGCSSLTSIEIPGSVTNIGYGAFSGCSGLTSIKIPGSVTNIEYLAFSDCSGLTSIEIPGSVTSIGASAFSDCSGLTSIKILGSVTSIEDSVFSGCSGLRGIEIPESVISIGEYAFAGCSGLASIEIPGSVTSIGASAFSGCSELASIEIPRSVTGIGRSVFAYCSNLTSIVVDPGNTIYSSGNGDNCIIEKKSNKLITGCKTTIISKGVTSIGEYVFSGCGNLTSIKIPGSVTSIGEYAVYDCSGLTSIEIPGSVTSIGEYAVDSSVIIYGESGSYAETWAQQNGNTFIAGKMPQLKDISACMATLTASSYAYTGEAIEPDVTVTDGEKILEKDTDYTVSYEDNIDVGIATVIVTGEGNYTGETELTFEIVPENIPGDFTYIVTDAAIMTIEITGYTGSDTDIVIPEEIDGYTVTRIGDGAFEGCDELTSIEIPGSVMCVGNRAFYMCSRLADIKIPKEVTTIEDYTFYGCSSLTDIEIPNGVTSIGNSAFRGCSGLTSIEIGSSIIDIKAAAFFDCNGLTSIKISEGLRSIGKAAFYGCTGLTSVKIPGSVTSIGEGVFTNCSNLISIELPKSVINIGDWAIGKSVDIYGESGSYAETWAQQNGNTFIPIRTSQLKDISACMVVLSVPTCTYAGTAQTPAVTVKDGSTILKKDTDYTVSYANNTRVGTATVTVTGKGNYTGSKTLTFTITAKSLSACKAALAVTTCIYTGAAQMPGITVKDGNATLKKDTDYTVSYANNTKVGTATVTIIGKGNYSGSQTMTFAITAKNISDCTISKIANELYTGKALKPGVTVKDGSKPLKKDTDYTVSYANNKKAGKATVTVTGKGNYTGSKKVNFTIIKNVSGVKAASAGYNSVKVSWEKVSGVTGYKVYRAESKNGKYKCVKTVKGEKATSYKDGKLTTGKTYYYKVKPYLDKKEGSFSKVVSAKPVPAKAAISSVKNSASKTATVKWKKVSGASGYEIYSATSKNGKYKKVTTIKKGGTVSYKNTKLKKGKTYYYKVRAYRMVDGKKIYGAYSSVESVKMKK